uniref:uncharacterized protein LOC113474421 isoform X1 n=1 Tax=Ciona intestinalis TaxID=7719 RepID=UPI000EF4E19C|nr:uncharacterized protein LOC113474421 isoform X1 [Ciona intestinalis]|eukprot:XP_026691258.1 uncharacterized protein LOC113474421 isoform X1 [Ciona intestinalis]
MRCVFKVLVFSLNFICLAAQGRQQLVARTTPSPEYVELLKEFWPNYNERCPTGYLMCRDESFCFDEAQLCGGNDVCIDSSDDINAICLGITRPLTRVTTPRLTTSELVTRMTTTELSSTRPETSISASTTTTTTSKKTTNRSTTTKKSVSITSFNDFGNPLVIAFFVLVGGLLVYLGLVSVCCISQRMNIVNPAATGASRPVHYDAEAANRPYAQQQAKTRNSKLNIRNEPR